MPILSDSALSVKIPKLVKIEQIFDKSLLQNIDEKISQLFEGANFPEDYFKGKRIALAVGSRGINKIDLIVKSLINELKKYGGMPVIIPAMGSHGGATAKGQLEVLNNFGIDELRMQVPIVSSMEVIKIGQTNEGIDIFIDRTAFESDLIIPIGRIKPHTDFNGKVESGLCKMLAIGLGKHVGCSRIHQEGFESFSKVIPEIASIVIENSNVCFGIGIIENAYDKTFNIDLVEDKEILKKEPDMLLTAKKLMPRILVDEIDVLIIEEIGKEISGAGADPNIIGRTTRGIKEGYDGPKINRIIVLGLSEKTHGNACGIGLADFSLRSILSQIDYEATYANVIASGNPEAGRIPVLLECEEEAIKAAISCCTKIDYNSARIVKIKNTLDLSMIEVSENIAAKLKNMRNIRIVEG